MFVFVHAQDIKTVHAGGGGGEKGENCFKNGLNDRVL